MATTHNVDFGQQVSAWTQKSEARMLAVLRESTQTLISKAQERIPVDTGFARASIQASLSQMPAISTDKREEGSSYTYDSGAVVGVIAQAKIGDVIHVGWTANYARILEDGHSKQAPTGFVAVSVMEWPSIVSATITEAKASVNSGGA